MIKQIDIENFKSIKQASIPLGDLNILIGSNGAGKSNFIAFLEMLQHVYDQELGLFVLESGGIDRLLYQGRKHSAYIGGKLGFENSGVLEFRLKPSVGNKAFVDSIACYENGSIIMEEKAVEESNFCHIFGKTSLNDNILGIAVYHFHDTSKSSPMRTPCRIGDNTTLRHDGANLAAYLYRMQNTAPASFRLIENVVKSIAPYFKRFVLSPDRNSPDMITLEWEEKNSDMYLDAYSFSDGTIRFIAMATVLLQPNLPGTIIIDEPELGLHPFAVNKLCALIRKAATRTQIIVATQSVNIVNCFIPEEIVTVDRKDNMTSFERLDTEALQGWLDDYSIGEIWEKNIIGGQP